MNLQEQNLINWQEFKVGFGLEALHDHNGKLLFMSVGKTSISRKFSKQKYMYVHFIIIFSGSCKIDEMSNSNKACLISTSPPNEAIILKCFMKLMCNGKEIISYNGNVFSIDETKNVHSWNSGGLIYPSNLMWDHLGLAGLEILVSVK